MSLRFPSAYRSLRSSIRCCSVCSQGLSARLRPVRFLGIIAQHGVDRSHLHRDDRSIPQRTASRRTRFIRPSIISSCGRTSLVARQTKRASTTPDVLPVPCAASSFWTPLSLFWTPLPLFPRSSAPFPGQLLSPRACPLKPAKPAQSQSLMISTLPLKPRPNPPQPAPVRCTWSQPTCGILSLTCGSTSQCPRSTPNPFQTPVEILLGPPNPPAKPVSCLRTKDPLPWSFFAIKTPLRGLEACSIKQ